MIFTRHNIINGISRRDCPDPPKNGTAQFRQISFAGVCRNSGFAQPPLINIRRTACQRVICQCEFLHFAPLENVGTSNGERGGLISSPEYRQPRFNYRRAARKRLGSVVRGNASGDLSLSLFFILSLSLSRTRAVRAYVNHLRARNPANGPSSYRRGGALEENPHCVFNGAGRAPTRATESRFCYLISRPEYQREASQFLANVGRSHAVRNHGVESQWLAAPLSRSSFRLPFLFSIFILLYFSFY